MMEARQRESLFPEDGGEESWSLQRADTTDAASLGTHVPVKDVQITSFPSRTNARETICLGDRAHINLICSIPA